MLHQPICQEPVGGGHGGIRTPVRKYLQPTTINIQ